MLNVKQRRKPFGKKRLPTNPVQGLASELEKSKLEESFDRMVADSTPAELAQLGEIIKYAREKAEAFIKDEK